MTTEYCLELFPVDQETLHLYVNSLTSVLGEPTFTNDGSRAFARNNDNAGLDLYTARNQTVSGQVTLLDMGVKARMSHQIKKKYEHMSPETIQTPVHYWLAPRSSIWKQGVTQANSIGVIDQTYRGNLMGAVLPIYRDKEIMIPGGTRLFQVLAPDMGHISCVILRPLSQLDETSRGSGGFGSTG